MRVFGALLFKRAEWNGWHRVVTSSAKHDTQPKETIMLNQWFPTVGKIPYDPKAKGLAYRYFDPARTLSTGRTMAQEIRPSVCAWHTVCGDGADQFGPGTRKLPWLEGTNPEQIARQKAEALFEIAEKTGMYGYCWHNGDLAWPGDTLRQFHGNVRTAARWLKDLQQQTSIPCLWGTCNLFSDPKYRSGAGTAKMPEVWASAAADIATMLEVCKDLEAEGYVFWGGREGFMKLMAARIKADLDHYAALLHKAAAHAKTIGFNGQFWEEPKPKEPTKHQYAANVQAVHAFVQQYGLTGILCPNIEENHAGLDGFEIAAQVAYALAYFPKVSFDANQGADHEAGWDLDFYPFEPRRWVMVFYYLLKRNQGIAPGGFNLDAKLTREENYVDTAAAIVTGVDNLAKALLAAESLAQSGEYEAYLQRRYGGWNGVLGARILAQDLSLSNVRDLAYDLQPSDFVTPSNQATVLEAMINRHLDAVTVA